MIRLTLLLAAAAALMTMTASCGGGSSQPPISYDFETGTAQQALTLDLAGRLPAETTLVTPSGVRLTIPPNTSMRTRRGTRVFGDVTIGVDDSGGPDALKPAPPALQGVVRVWVKDGSNLLDVIFDPPLTLEVELGDWSLPGGWTTCTNVNVATRRFVLGPDPLDLSGPGNAGTAVTLSAVTANNTGPEQIPVDQTGPTGFLFVEQAGGLQKIGSASTLSTSTVTLPIPGGAGTWPKVYSWSVVCVDTAQIVAIGTVDGGMINGQSQSVSYGGNTYTATVVNDGAGRRLEITSDVNNVFFVEVQLCNEDGSGSSASGTADGGSDDEADTGGTYAGDIEITIFGWGGARDEIDIWDQIDAALGAIGPTVQDWFVKTGSDTYAASGRVFGYSGSTQTLAGDLQSSNPDWDVDAGNRTITITIPCPPQTTATSSGLAQAVSIRDPANYSTELFPVPLGVTLQDAAVSSNGEWMAVASTARLDMIALSGPTSMNVALSGVDRAVAIGPFDALVYAALDTGELVAYDLETGVEAWSLATLPAFFYYDLVVSPDGAFAYATISSQNQVIEIDLVHRVVGRTFSITAPQGVDVSFSSRQLAVTSQTGGGVHLVDLVTGNVGPLIPTGMLPSDVVWTPDDEFLLVANPLSDTVTLVDAQTSTVVTNIAVGPAPIAVTAWRDATGTVQGLVAREGNPSALPTPIPPALAAFEISNTPLIVPDIFVLTDVPMFVRVNGR